MTRHNRYKVSDEVLLKSTSSIIGVASLAVAVTVGLIPSGHYDNDAHATNSHPSLCDIGWTQEPGVDIEQAARDCVADRTGKVALIGYQIDMPYLQDIAREAEAEISDGTNGLVRPEIIPLLASPEAVHQLNEANKSCQPDVIERNGASIADATMDLDSYAHVVSLVGTTRCDGATIGLAHSPKNGRYADIELKKSSLYPKPREDGPDDFVSHELGHAYGLEHSGYLSTTKYGFEIFHSGFTMFGQKVDSVSLKPMDNTSISDMSTSDISPPEAVLTDREFLEYGGKSNIMGSHADKMYANAVQQWQLQWPERVLGTVPDRQQILNWSTVTLEHSKTLDHDFVALMLEKPAVFKRQDVEKKTVTETYQKLVFEPVPNSANRFRVFYADNDNAKTLELGYVSLESRSEQTLQFKIDDQLIQLKSIPGKGVEFSDLSAMQDGAERVAMPPNR
jgi:hypothetical protein